MGHGLIKTTLLAAASAALVLSVGCERRGAKDNTSGMAQQPATADTMASGMRDTMEKARDTSAAPAALTDANIVALLDEANKADSAAGAFAVTRATNPDVKAFAKLMMSEHHALRVQGQQVAKAASITPAPPTNDPVKTAAASEMSVLQSTPKGPQFDRAYIDQEVTVHQAVIGLADQSHRAATNAQLKALLEKARPTLQKHLDRAKDLQQKLGSSTSSTRQQHSQYKYAQTKADSA